jgi:hypothetical protein
LAASNVAGALSLGQGGTGSTNASDARTALGLGTASTNPSSAFQPSSTVLSNLASSNAVNLTNLRVTNIVGWSALTNSNTATSLLGFTANGQVVANTGTNVLTFTNGYGVQAYSLIVGDTNFRANFYVEDEGLAISVYRTNAETYIGNLGFTDNSIRLAVPISFQGTNTTATTRTNLGLGATWLTNTNVTNFRTAIGLASYVTNPIVPLTNGGTGATNIATARTNLGLGWPALTNTNAATSLLGFTTNGQIVAETNVVWTNAFNFSTNTVAAQVRTNLGLGATWLTNTNVTNFRTNIGLGWSALTNTNAATSLLGFTTNGQVIANTGTNVLTFTNPTYYFNGNVYSYSYVVEEKTFFYTNSATLNSFALFLNYETNSATYGSEGITFNNESQKAISRTNLGLPLAALTNTSTSSFRSAVGLGATWLTNTNSANFRSDIGLGWPALTNTNAGTGLVSVSTNGEVVSPTNFWQQAPIATTVAFSAPATNSTNTATNSRNLIIQSLSSNIVNTTNTLLLPTNTSTFNGDTAVVIHAGGSGSATAIRQAGQTSNLVVLTNFDHAVRFLYFNNTWDFYHNLAYVEPIYFSGTNAAALAASSRTNLALGATWLTNTNVTNFRTAIGLGATNDVTFNVINAGSRIWLADQGLIEGDGDLYIQAGAVIFNSPIQFINAATTATTRTNLGIPLTALTNSNTTNFQAAVFQTNTTPAGAAFNNIVAWMEVNVITNGSNTSFRIPLFK